MSKQLLAFDEMRDLRVPYDRPVFLILLHLRVLKVFNETVEPLKPRIGQVAYLNRASLTFSLLNLDHFLPWKCW